MKWVGEARVALTNRTELPWDVRRPTRRVKPGHLSLHQGAATSPRVTEVLHSKKAGCLLQ